MDPATAAALISGVASVGGSILQNKAQEKAAEQAAAQRAAEIANIKQYGARAMESLLPAYQASQDVRQQALNQNLALTGQTLRPMIGATQTGDYMAQQALLSGLMGQRAAILGDPINYGALQAQSVPIDWSALSGLTSPQSMEFTPFQQVQYSDTGVTDWNANQARKYLQANPDVEADYNVLKAQLIAGGDPQFRTLEGYAKWHYDNYGRAEGRPLEPSASGTSSGPDFSSEQVARIFKNMGGEP